MRPVLHTGYILLFAFIIVFSLFTLFGAGFLEGMGTASLLHIFIMGSLWAVSYGLHLLLKGWKGSLLLFLFTVAALVSWFAGGYLMLEQLV
ncbi:hypothetical protein [Salibacterium aidingense]|uniref:hypothetical protein n=1 Tax=Salibacterium aidingense TaxID=384933 RepID=UPI003BEDA144